MIAVFDTCIVLDYLLEKTSKINTQKSEKQLVWSIGS